MSNNQTSSFQSYVDSATGAVQNAIGSATGNQKDQTEGQAKKAMAEDEYDASHAAVKGPGFAASGSGALAKDDPDRGAGQWNQTMGSAKQTVGGLLGAEGLKEQGRRQNVEGQEQEAKGQISDLGSGVGDRVTGAVGGAVSGITGDRQEQLKYQDQHDKGKTLQRGAEHDIEKQAQAQQKAD
ncbi:hypothetical protein MKZ38_007235 [Zalerion maritima]|uniref:CsbD-like domain-containing protein n=1 Tax=Zalerion maritima TaxID=339359 RepID=A0AAD5WPB2_9PEZI|nr:hypothetical protein MKZ38_007235 [Zalerion maritima]